MPGAADALRELHRIHRQLADLRDRLERGPKQVRAREATVTRFTQQLEEAQQQSKSARMSADQKQLQLKSNEAKIDDLKRKLNSASSNREYQALKDQIAADEMANSVLEDEILEALQKIDVCQVAIAEAKQRLAKGQQELQTTQQTVAKEEGELRAEVLRVEAELTRAEQELPSDVRDGYLRVVRSRGSDAMAEVDGEHCTGCFQRITPNQNSLLRMGSVVYCGSCGRLLYLPEDRTPGLGR